MLATLDSIADASYIKLYSRWPRCHGDKIMTRCTTDHRDRCHDNSKCSVLFYILQYDNEETSSSRG